MSNLVTDLLKKQLTDQFYDQASEKLGLNGQQGRKLVDNAVPSILGGLAKNASSKAGASALLGALKDKRHDGSILSNTNSFFESRNLDEGDKILKHVLGDTREDIAEALAAESGTNLDVAKKALAGLSPMVMGALGKAVQSKKLNTDQLGPILNLAIKEKDLGKAAHRIAMLIWDKDGDGQYKDDLFEMGKRWVSGFLSQKKK